MNVDLIHSYRLISQGAEAKIWLDRENNVIFKERFSKKYRHTAIDTLLIKKRTRAESRLLTKLKEKVSFNVPSVYQTDESKGIIKMEFIDGISLKQYLFSCSNENDLIQIGKTIGRDIAKLHDNGITHGDLTSSNILYGTKNPEASDPLIYIDWGLAVATDSANVKAIDLYVLQRALSSTHSNADTVWNSFIETYFDNLSVKKADVKNYWNQVQSRGRKKNKS